MSYRKRQIQNVVDETKNSKFFPTIKLSCGSSQTNYMNITVAELKQIQELLKLDIA